MPTIEKPLVLSELLRESGVEFRIGEAPPREYWYTAPDGSFWFETPAGVARVDPRALEFDGKNA